MLSSFTWTQTKLVYVSKLTFLILTSNILDKLKQYKYAKLNFIWIKESKLTAHIANFINDSLISKVLSSCSWRINTY